MIRWSSVLIVAGVLLACTPHHPSGTSDPDLPATPDPTPPQIPTAPRFNDHEVICLGDSITQGAPLVAIPYPSTLETQLGPDWVVTNAGVAGEGLEQIRARWETEYRGGDAAFLVVLGGINNITSGGSALTLWWNLRLIADDAFQQGRHVLLVTVLPFGHSPAFTATAEVERVALNAYIRAYCSGGLATCVDAAASFDDGTGALLADLDFGDGIHLDQVGADRLAAGVLEAVRGMRSTKTAARD